MEQPFVKTHFWEINLCDLLDVLGEDEVKSILSSFAFVGYYTISSKLISVDPSAVNSREAKKLREHGVYDVSKKTYTASAILVGQLGKNYANGNDTLIGGTDILNLAIKRVKEVQKQVGGRFVYLECEEVKKLLTFYINNNFKIFGKRELDKDEVDVKGKYLIQLFALV